MQSKTIPWLPMLLSLLAFLVILPFIATSIDIHHDYILLKPAIDVNDGNMLFRDTFTQYGALTTILQASAVHFYPQSPLIAIRTLTALTYAVIALMLWIIWSKFLSPLTNTTAVILWLALAAFYNWGLMPWSSVFALAFQCLTIMFFPRLPLVAGITAAAVVWTRQPVGVFLFGAILFYSLFTRQLRHALVFLIGSILASAPLLLWLTVNGALTDWWLQSFGLAAAFVSCKQFSCLPYVGLDLSAYRVWHDNFKHLIWLLLPAATVYSAVIGRPFFLLTIVSLASWLQYYPMADPYHFFWAASPMVGILIYYIVSATKGRYNLLLLALTVILLMSRIRVGYNHIANQISLVTVPSSAHGMKATPGHTEYYTFLYQTLEAYFAANPHKHYLNLTPDAFYATLNPQHFVQLDAVPVNWPLINDSIYPRHLPQLLEDIAVYRPVVLSNTTVPSPDYCVYNLPSRVTKLYLPKESIETFTQTPLPPSYTRTCPQ